MVVDLKNKEEFKSMAKLNTPKGKLVRKLGVNIFGNPKFDRLLSKKGHRPGQHGKMGKRPSTYALQLQEKQKIKAMFGVLEKQFRNYFHKAEKMDGETGTNLLQLLECRLDNVVYKMGLGASRTESRQIVKHNAILVNGKRVNIPSYQVAPGDEVSVVESSKNQLRIKGAIEAAQERGFPEWVEVDVKAFKGTYKNKPLRDDLPSTINESLVVELYSK